VAVALNEKVKATSPAELGDRTPAPRMWAAALMDANDGAEMPSRLRVAAAVIAAASRNWARRAGVDVRVMGSLPVL
jgi:hypothetical protein